MNVAARLLLLISEAIRKGSDFLYTLDDFIVASAKVYVI